MATELPVVETRLVRGCCPLDCQDTCSWIAHVQDGRVVRLEGAKDHPITRGALCAKVNDYQERTYAPDRILQPLRRVGRKGDGAFEPITWVEALDTIADRLTTIIASVGPEAILPVNYLGSMGVVQRRALMRVFHALGASRFHGSVCGAAGNIVEAEGHPRGFDPELFPEARFILLWGANLLSTAHHQWRLLDEARRRHGARIVAIDPVRSRTAKAADEHISIRPGTDAVLAAGLGHVLLTEGLADRTFAESVATDFEAFEAGIAAWTPDRVEAVTDVPAATVVRLAREFARARPALIRAGVAPQQTVGGEATVRALSGLAIIGGHWQLPGGGLYIESGPELDERRASRPDLQPREARSLDMARLGEHLTSDELDPPIRALVVWNMNPAVTQPDATVVRRGLEREALFTVVLEHFLTDTARYADIVLPSTTQLEHFDLQGSWGHHYISVNQPAIQPLGDALPHGEIARRLAARLGLANPALFESDQEIAASALPDGVTLGDVMSLGWLKRSPVAQPFGAGRQMVSIAQPIVAPVRPAGDSLQLLTPKSHWFLNTTFGNMARHRGRMRAPTLEMHGADAAARGLVDGDQVEVANERGRLCVVVRLSEDMHPGVVALPGKWWGTPPDTAAVANLLSPYAFAPHGQPAYNDTYVTVTKLGTATGVVRG